MIYVLFTIAGTLSVYFVVKAYTVNFQYRKFPESR